MKGAYVPFLVILFCLCILPIAYSQEGHSSAEAYLEELHLQGKERVIVTFKDEINLSLVEQYDGEVIRPLKIINGLICEIPRENIELLKEEDEVENLAIDGLAKAQPGSEKRDRKDFIRFLRCKRKYFKTIRREYRSAIRDTRKEFRKALKVCRLDRSDGKGYRTCLKQATKEYREKIAMARNCYGVAVGEWEEKVNEMVAMSYGGPVEVRWNNLEAGLNSQAAWDNYDLDGTGIKIAFLDTGVNYTLENLNDNYLGGYDYVGTPPDYFSDDDPINQDDNEVHGTEVVSLAVGEGVDKVVGVAYNASYYVVRVLEGYDPPIGWIGDVISGIEWASTEPHKADIISMSFCFYEPVDPTAKIYLRNACNSAYAQGIVLVAGSGNGGDPTSGYPAAFANVISVGAHTIDQTIASFSNGGVDVVAPGGDGDIITPEDNLYTVHPDNSAWWVWGTSFATPHVSALIALQLQYARLDDRDVTGKFPFDANNGYNWEVMKHSAWPLTGETYDPVYQGNGKIWAAETTDPEPPPTPHDGSIDCIAGEWPLDYEFVFDNWIYLDQGLYPAYFIGTSMYQDIILTNNTDTVGQYASHIEEVKVSTTQAYYGHSGEVNMPGSPVKVFPTETVNAGNAANLEDTYYLPWSTIPGLNRTILDMEFEFTDDTNDRLIKVAYPYPEDGIWCPPPALNEGFPIE